jgi:signal transduction histidine kinase
LLDERLRFETLLLRLSATFIHLPAYEVDSQIERGLRQIVDFLQIERGSLGQFSEDGSELVATHSHTVPGYPPVPRGNLAALWPWYTAKIRGGEVLRFTRLPDDPPPEAVNEREPYLRGGFPQSHLAIPLKVGESVLGVLSFGSFRRPFDWPDDLVQSLQRAGEVFANALARKRAEEREACLREQLARVARVTLTGALAASIVDEVNQPLGAIVCNVRAIQRWFAVGYYDINDVRAALENINRDGQRASTAVAQIRGLLPKAPVVRSPVDVNDLIREASALVRGEMARRGVVVKLKLAEKLPSVLGDRAQLQQVILNLMTNGADAMAPPTLSPERSGKDVGGLHELVIRSAEDGMRTVTVAVQDAGVGLDPLDSDCLFTTKPGGMGMELAVCKSIIADHGGRIWANPNPGGGTTFQFTLPIGRDRATG